MTAGLPTARHRIPHHHVRRGVALALTTVLATGGAAVAAAAAPSDASPIAPREAAYGFFVDAYSGNTAAMRSFPTRAWSRWTAATSGAR